MVWKSGKLLFELINSHKGEINVLLAIGDVYQDRDVEVENQQIQVGI